MSWLFGAKYNKQSGTSTTNENTTQDPWAPAIPYLTEALGTGKSLYDQYSQLSPEEKAAADSYASVLRQRQGSPVYGQITGAASDILSGKYNPNTAPVASATPSAAITAQPMELPQVRTQYMASPSQITAGQAINPQVQTQYIADTPTVSAVNARAAEGELDPTSSLKRVLSGQVDNPQLSAMADAATRQGQRNYADAVQDSSEALTRSVLPSVRSGAILSGGYGGTRQGIAEGLAISDRQKNLDRGARDLGIAGTDAASNLFGNAYEAAQGRMASTANDLDTKARETAAENANRRLDVMKTNAGNALAAGMKNADLSLDTQKFNIGTGVDAQQRNVDNNFRASSTNVANDLAAGMKNADLSFNWQNTNIGNDLRAKEDNAASALNYAKLNSDIASGNNQTELSKASLIPSIFGQGANLFTTGNNAQNDNFGQQMSVLGLPRSVAFDSYGGYVSPLTGIAGLGGTKQGTSTTKSSGSSWGLSGSIGKGG